MGGVLSRDIQKHKRRAGSNRIELLEPACQRRHDPSQPSGCEGAPLTRAARLRQRVLWQRKPAKAIYMGDTTQLSTR